MFGVDLPEEFPRIVASTRLQEALARPLGLREKEPVTARQTVYLESLAKEALHQIPLPETKAEASAWIEYFRLRKREEVLSELRLNRGDVVSGDSVVRGEAEVVSIGEAGVVYLKQQHGTVFPDTLSVVSRGGAGHVDCEDEQAES